MCGAREEGKGKRDLRERGRGGRGREGEGEGEGMWEADSNQTKREKRYKLFSMPFDSLAKRG